MANLLFVFIKKVIILGRLFGYCILLVLMACILQPIQPCFRAFLALIKKR